MTQQDSEASAMLRQVVARASRALGRLLFEDEVALCERAVAIYLEQVCRPQTCSDHRFRHERQCNTQGHGGRIAICNG